MSGRPKSQSGFSFVELVVIIVIIGVLAVVVVPRLTPQVAFDHAGFHQEVVAGIRYAQKYAVASGCPIRVIISTNQLALRHSSSCGGGDFSIALRHPVRGGGYTVNAPSGVTMGPGSTFQFLATGEASADIAFNVIAGSATRPVAVVAATGYVDTP